MPELPEVETTCRGIRHHLVGNSLTHAEVRVPKLRWPIPKRALKALVGKPVIGVKRRAKYILIEFETTTLIVHLGMSGRLYFVDSCRPPGKHDHLDLVLSSERILRFTDPRRFGCVLVSPQPQIHPLLENLGPEPLEAGFDGAYLKAKAQGRKVSIKQFIMQGQVVVGVGNIYASESLFRAGIHPLRAANKISLARYVSLVESIKRVLEEAIEAGGTTLKDFLNGSAQPGYFQQSLSVYGRANLPCDVCGRPIKSQVIAQRSTFYCGSCQH